MAFGPLMASMIEQAGLDFSYTPFADPSLPSDGWRNLLGIRYQTETAPGWIMFVLWALSWLAVFLLFKNPTKASEVRDDFMVCFCCF